MGKLKIIAKSHMLSRTAPILCTFSVCISAWFFSGNFSFFVSYFLNSSLFENSSLEENVKSAVIIISSLIGIILTVALCAPLKVGRERWFILNAKGEKPKFHEIFFYFRKGRFFKSVFAVLYAESIKFAAAAVFFFPSVCLFGILYYCIFYHATAFAIILCLIIAEILLITVGSAFMFIYSGEFLMYYPIIISNRKVTPFRALSYSRAMTSPVLLKIAVFRLSFFPWWLLSLGVFPAFYCWGYYKQSLSELAYRNEYLK